MISNYIKIALRNLFKNKLFSTINITGMAVSLASCFLIALFVWDELQFDQYIPDKDRTYRIYNVSTTNDGVTGKLPIVPMTFAPYMQKDFPEIESTLRIMDTYSESLFQHGTTKMFENNGIYAEPTIFDILDVHLVRGERHGGLDKPNTVVLSENTARKHFGEKDPVGETLKIGREDFVVTGIFSEVPQHSHLKINYIQSLESQMKNITPEQRENWVWQQFFTYIKLKPGASAAELESKLLPFVQKYAYPKIEPEGFKYVPHLQNVTDIHLNSSDFEWEMAQRGNAQTVYILSFTGFFLMIIACLNFINLSTARSIRRMKEVGVRKVTGARRTQIVWQFIFESVLITLFSLLLAIVICEFSIPALNNFAEKNLYIPLTLPVVTGVIGFCILLGIIAGSYPAFHLSAFRPAAALSGKSHSDSTAFFRQGLVVLQFMFSFFLITGSMIVLSQNDLLKNKDMGFSKDQLIMIPLRSKMLNEFESTKQEFSKNKHVLNATVGFGIPGDIIAGDGIIDPVTNKAIPTNLFAVDHDYISTMGMHIVAGRDFSRAFPSDLNHGFIINETAVKNFGFESPEKAIGHPLNWKQWGKDSLKIGEVIGVVRDFHFKSLREQLSPAVLTMHPDAYWKLTLRVEPQDLSETMAFLKSTYERLDPEWPFTYKFVNENYDTMYKSETKLSSLFGIFTGLAVAVACLGLFGLVEYSVHQRTREISIRKVFGASVNSLLILLTRKYFALVMIAFLVIIPVSYYAAGEWLSNFAYHVTISPWLYLKACGAILLITVLTVSFQSLKAAWTNPAKTLRSE